MKVVIVGGVAGGATAAARIRRLDERAEIVVFERSGYVSYANCGLPYYVGGAIADAADLTLQTPESFRRRFRIRMEVNHEVVAVDTDARTVTVRNLVTGEEFRETYDKLLLSPGARPVRPPVPGADSPRLFNLRTVEDTLRIRRFVDERHPRTAVVVGGGFIGLELAENLREAGLDVTVVQRPAHLMSPFDADMASFIHAEMRRHGVRLALGRSVAGFAERDDGGTDVLIEGEPPLSADLVAVAIGVAPDTDLAQRAGLETGIKGSIVVNDRMETSAPDVFAVGDAVQVRHAVTGKDALVSLAGPANKQGRIAADNICGGDSRFSGSQGSSVIKVFDLTAATTGINETVARREGLDFDKVVLSPLSHAGYYPGGRLMTVKLLFERGTYRILGAQIVGYEGVDKRIDVVACAMAAGLTAVQLRDLDLAYAPPYSSAKDPVNMAGYMVENIARGVLSQFHAEDVEGLRGRDDVQLVDVRTSEEHRRAPIEGFRNIPLDELRDRLGELDPGKPVYALCQSGLRSYLACRILAGNGFTAHNLSGGARLYEAVAADRALATSAAPCGADAPAR